MNKPEGYYEKNRDELLPFIPFIEGAVVLDIGCGAGGFGRLLKGQGRCKLYGIEQVAGQAERAATIYDEIYCENVEAFKLPFPPDTFDVIICADVLEHLVDPWSLLLKLRPLLKPAGTLIACIPNIRHATVIGRILRGEFGYDSQGILDKDHLRFFTFNDIVKLFVEQKYRVVDVSAQSAQGADETISKWKQDGVPRKLQEIIKLFCNVDYEFRDDELSDFFIVQWIFAVVRTD